MVVIGVPMELARWDRAKGPTVENLVLVEARLADRLDEEGPQGAIPDEAIRKRITER